MKTLSVQAAADFEVNTNFILPKFAANNRMLHKANQQRQQALNPSTSADEPLRPASLKYKQFMLNSKEPVAQYDNLNFHSSRPQQTNSQPQFTLKRPNSTNNTRMIQKDRHDSPKSQGSKYVNAVKAASKMLRSSIVQTYVDQLQTTIQIPKRKDEILMFEPVSKSLINKALMVSVSKTERRLKSSCRDRLNSSLGFKEPQSRFNLKGINVEVRPCSTNYTTTEHSSKQVKGYLTQQHTYDKAESIKGTIQNVISSVSPVDRLKDFDKSCIQQMGNFEIYVPTTTTLEDQQLQLFKSHVNKGYLNQAEAVLNTVQQHPAYQFNMGLILLLRGSYPEAIQALSDFRESKNFKYAAKQIEKAGVSNQTRFCKTKSIIVQNPIKRQKTVLKLKTVNEWDLFLMHVRKYKMNEAHKFIRDKKLFDKQLQSLNYFKADTMALIPDVDTKIIKEDGMNLADTEQIIQCTVARTTEEADAVWNVYDKDLETQFIELINIQSTYCVGAKDPFKESFDELVEGLRQLHELFGIEAFVLGYYEAMNKPGRAAVEEFLAKNNIDDKFFKRARTFMLACFDREDSEDKKEVTVNFLLSVVWQAQEARQKRLLDPERFAVEQLFNHLIQDVEIASRNEREPGEFGPVQLSEEDQHWVDRLRFHKVLSGRENTLQKLLELTKQELNDKEACKSYVGRAENFHLIETGVVAPQAIHEMEATMYRVWQQHIKKPLSEQELQIVKDQVALEVKQIEEEVRLQHEKQKQSVDPGQTAARGLQKLPKKKNAVPFQKRFNKALLHRVQKQQEFLLNDQQLLAEIQAKKPQQQKQFLFAADRMVVENEPVVQGSYNPPLWADHPSAERLRQLIYNIQLMCQDQQIIFDRDRQKLTPLLERWGIEAEKESKNFDFSDSFSAQKQRPKIGQELPHQQLQKLVQNLRDIKYLLNSELNELDRILESRFRFFSIIDKDVRFALYKSLEFISWQNKGTLIEADVDTTDFVYVVLSGLVNYKIYKAETCMTVIAATYHAGEVFGDASIQKQFFDVLKCLSHDRQYLETDTDNVYCLRIPKKAFVEAIFAEMRVELMFKILLFRKTPYFKELSPYSLIMFASICEVKDYKFGEVILSQGEKPNACYLVAHGCCQSVYQYVEEHSTKVSQYARKVLKSQLLRFNTGNLATVEKPKAQTKPKQVMEEEQIIKTQIKRAQTNGVLSRDDKHSKITYENHIVYGDVKVGDVFGVRTLLDNLTCSKFVLSNSIKFAEQLCISAEVFYDQVRDEEDAKQSQEQQSQKIVAKAVQSMKKFCKKCFEARKTKCRCAVDGLSPQEQELVAEMEDSGNFTEEIEISEVSSYKESIEDICSRRFVEQMLDSLIRSQTTIFVTSATAKLIVIKKEDKTFLNEALKQSIDKVILDQNFKDCDRPLENFRQLQKQVEKTRGWIQFKKKMETQVLRAAQRARSTH